MLTTAKAMAILAFTGAVTASPAPQGGKTFSLDPIAVRGVAPHQLEHMVKLRRSLGVDVHPKLAEAAQQATARKRENHLAARKVSGTALGKGTDEWNTIFGYPLKIAGTTFNLLVSTSLSDLVVPSSAQPADQRQGNNFYKVNPAHKIEGAFWGSDDPNDPDPRADVYEEYVEFGGISTKQVFAAVTNATGGLIDDGLDGWLGLGLSEVSTIQPNGTNNLIFNMLPQLAKPYMGIAHTKKQGRYDFGFFDQKKIGGPIAWVTNKWEEYWAAYGFYAEGWSLGGPDAKITKRKMNIHINSGTILSFTDTDTVNEFYARIPGANTTVFQAYTIPCNSKPPGWTLQIAGQKFYTPGCQLIAEPVDDKGERCLGGLQRIGGNVDFSLIGMNFLEGKYMLHDFTNPDKDHIKLGFAMQPGSAK